MSDIVPPDSDFTRQAGEASRLLKVMGNESRLLVLCFLAEAGELSVGDLAGRVGLSQSALSQHLAKLREDKLVASHKEAQSVFYRVRDPNAQRVLELLHEIFCPELGQSPQPSDDSGDNT